MKGGEGATDAGTGERRVGAVELEPDEQEKRMEVLAKFLFVYAVLTKTQRGAEHVSRTYTFPIIARRTALH